uniref:C2H2-type domain-containing protein n=1 Tax=Cyprinus carpio TaxID=7962 RepID=A0A8C1M8T8_CYPCA
MSKYRQFHEQYVVFSFTSTSTEPPQPLCFLCGDVLSNNSMKPAHLQRHLNTKHLSCVSKTAEFFQRKLSEFKGSQEKLKKATAVSTKALEASYAVSLLVAKSKKPFTVAEELILPAAVILAETMIDKKAADALKTVPLSNNTVCWRIDDMAVDIVDQVVEKLKLSGSFALQLDESTDVSGEAQLIAFVRYRDISEINEHILFCKKLTGSTTVKDVFHVIDTFFSEHNLDWKSCIHVCTDGAASMTGRVKGLIAQIKKVNPDVQWNHCIIHREALASKRMSPELHEVLNDAVKVINFVESRPLNHRLFERLCHDSGAEHQQLLLHTDVRWLSKGKALQRLLELRNEVSAFLAEHSHPLVVMLENTDWVARLAYLADFFSKLNNLNLTLQGKDTHILNMYDKVCGFMKKIKLWESKLQLVSTHLSRLNSEFNHYFPDIENRGLKMRYSETNLSQFWCDVEKEYPDLGKHALNELLPFGSTYLCEVTFSSMAVIKSKHRNRLNLEKSLIAAVATLPPRLTKLMSERQGQLTRHSI